MHTLCKMRQFLYGRDVVDDRHAADFQHLPPDSLPVIRRSIKTSKQQQDSHNTFGSIETGDTKNNPNKNYSSMKSSFRLHKDIKNNNSGGGGGRNLALGDGSGNTGNRKYASSVGVDAGATKETRLLGGTTNEGKASSRSSWMLLQKCRIILILLAIVYGSLNISMRVVFARPDPPTASASSTIQGWFSVICFIPLLWRNHCNLNNNNNNNNNNKNARAWFGTLNTIGKGRFPTKSSNDSPSFSRFALELAFFNFGTQAFINTSLIATQGARASFLVQMSVVFTPVVSVLFGQQKVGRRVWIGCFVALAGLFVLSCSEVEQADDSNDNDTFDYDYDENTSVLARSSTAPSFTLTGGDWCCLLAALCWSLYIYRLSAWGECFDETMTQFVKNIILAALYTLWMLVSFASRYYTDYYSFEQNEGTNETKSQSDNSVDLWKGWRNDPISWWILFYSALGPCTLADIFQQKAQSSVPAAETNVILSLEPVFTTLLGFLLMGEIPSVQELCGGFLIMIASFVVSCGPQSSSTAESMSCQ